jgi:NADH-quinone oxidoreductase subunit E
MLSEKEQQEIEEELRHCVVKQSASVEALKIVQKHRGWVSDEHLRDVAALLEMTHHELDSVATFYNMVFRRPVGRHVILVCGGVSCWIMEGVTVLDYLKKRLGIDIAQTTPDKRFTLLPAVCLGACDKAPVMMVDEDLHGNLTPEKVGTILERYP